MITGGSVSIADRLQQVRDRMQLACDRAGRSIQDVRLVAVSKHKPIELIREAQASGQTLFGENYVQEAREKIDKLPLAEWHFIGSLQTNKAKQVAGSFALVHSVDRVKLAQSLDLAAQAKSVIQPILLQVQIGHEDTKHGFSLSQLPSALAEIAAMPNLSLRGLMSLPPMENSEVAARANFAMAKFALEDTRARLPIAQRNAFRELSLGTSGDFEAAILEGATLVRIGTDIFGAR